MHTESWAEVLEWGGFSLKEAHYSKHYFTCDQYFFVDTNLSTNACTVAATARQGSFSIF